MHKLPRLTVGLLTHSMRPGRTLQRPFITRIFLAEFFRGRTQHGVIIAHFVLAHSAPINRFGRDAGVAALVDHGSIHVPGVAKFLVHKLHACQSHLQTRAKPVRWQITFNAIALHSLGIQYEDCRSPHGAEPFKPGRVFLNVSFERDEGLIDEIGSFGVAV